jgi:hypothetical protein
MYFLRRFFVYIIIYVGNSFFGRPGFFSIDAFYHEYHESGSHFDLG